MFKSKSNFNLLTLKGLTPHDIIQGIPFHKNLTKIQWPEGGKLIVSNTKVNSIVTLNCATFYIYITHYIFQTVHVSFKTFKGNPVKNPLASGNLAVEVYCDNVLIPLTTLMECSNEENLLIVFNAIRAGVYTIVLKSGFNLVRGFPNTRQIFSEDVDPMRTLFLGLR